MLPSYRSRQSNQLTGSYMIGTLVIEGLIKEKELLMILSGMNHIHIYNTVYGLRLHNKSN